MTLTESLLHCPFCGRHGLIEVGSDHYGEWFNLGCAVGIDALGSTCPGANMYYTHDIEDMEDCIKHWNTRATLEQPTNAVERVRKALSFYANPENWKWIAKPTDTDFILDCGSEVERDFGERARAALQNKEDL